jgi:hypothetical protein
MVSAKLTSLSDCMTNAKVASASIRQAPVTTKNKHEKTPHPIWVRGLLGNPNS